MDLMGNKTKRAGCPAASRQEKAFFGRRIYKEICETKRHQLMQIHQLMPLQK